MIFMAVQVTVRIFVVTSLAVPFQSKLKAWPMRLEMAKVPELAVNFDYLVRPADGDSCS